MTLTYQLLIKHLIKQHDYPINSKKNYSVIIFPGSKYHITIFEDQWDKYEEISNKPYHLFHISSNDEQERCSSYFWVERDKLIIKKIPRQYFMYNQPNYSFFSSTRTPCHLWNIKKYLKIFQKMLNKINLT